MTANNIHLIEFAKRGSFDDIFTPKIIADDFAQFFSEIYYWHMGKELNKVWECAGTEDSQISKAFHEIGINTLDTDIKTGYNYLEMSTPEDIDAIVTNPPYSLKDKFIISTIMRKKPFGLLVPVTALAGKARNRAYRELGNISLRVYSNRIDFTGKKNNWFNVMWIYWLPNYPTRIDFVEL